MAIDQTKYTTVDSVVRNLLIEENKSTTHEYARYLQIANTGLKILTFDVIGDTKATLMLVSSSLRADLPTDYVDYTFIGIVGSDGKLHPLGNRKNIPAAGSVAQTTALPDVYFYSYGGLYGYGGGQNDHGYYRPDIDYENWQMLFTSVYSGSYIYMEYTSDGMRGDGNSIVHPYCAEALSAFIYWRAIQRRRGVPQVEKDAARKEWFNEKRLARARICAFTKEEALQQIRKGFKQSPKL